MLNLTVPEFMLVMATAGFLLGVLSICIGIYTLVSKIFGREIKDIAAQTTKMAQKGITDDLSGLVGNASTLLSALNDLIKTSTGVGMFLVFLGILLLGGSSWLVLQITTLP